MGWYRGPRDVVRGSAAEEKKVVGYSYEAADLLAVLLQEVWGYRHASDTRLVNVHVQRLRSKVERDPERPEIIVTVRGVGYRAGEPRG